jgi:hypothetical protein
MKVGDLVKFSKDHANQPGLDYTKEWIGIIIAKFIRHGVNDTISIMWTIHGATTIMDYDKLWWLKLDYKPFEVINTNRK